MALIDQAALHAGGGACPRSAAGAAPRAGAAVRLSPSRSLVSRWRRVALPTGSYPGHLQLVPATAPGSPSRLRAPPHSCDVAARHSAHVAPPAQAILGDSSESRPSRSINPPSPSVSTEAAVGPYPTAHRRRPGRSSRAPETRVSHVLRKYGEIRRSLHVAVDALFKERLYVIHPR